MELFYRSFDGDVTVFTTVSSCCHTLVNAKVNQFFTTDDLWQYNWYTSVFRLTTLAYMENVFPINYLLYQFIKQTPISQNTQATDI